MPLCIAEFYLQIVTKRRADERTRTADLLITSELFLLDEQPILHHLGLRRVYWTVTNVKVGTTCVGVLSNSRESDSPAPIGPGLCKMLNATFEEDPL
jgi:hypothetical protein